MSKIDIKINSEEFDSICKIIEHSVGSDMVKVAIVTGFKRLFSKDFLEKNSKLETKFYISDEDKIQILDGVKISDLVEQKN